MKKAKKVKPRRRNTHTPEEWAKRITTAWQKSVESIIETGRLLIEAKAELPHGEFENMINEKLPFGSRTAQRLMKIADHPILSNPTHVSHLPPSWGTLYALTELPDEVLSDMLEDGKLNCEIERKDVEQIKAQLNVLGHYRWVNLRDALNQLITFSTKWSNVHALVERLQHDLDFRAGEEYLEGLVDYSKLSAVSKWIADFKAETSRVREERERQDAE